MKNVTAKSSNEASQAKREDKQVSSTLHLSLAAILGILVSCSSGSFFLGYIFRQNVHDTFAAFHIKDNSKEEEAASAAAAVVASEPTRSLPDYYTKQPKHVSIYSSEPIPILMFNTENQKEATIDAEGRVVTSDQPPPAMSVAEILAQQVRVATKNQPNQQQEEKDDQGEKEDDNDTNEKDTSAEEDEEDDEDDDNNNPTGDHLLIDMKNVDSSVIGSPELIGQALLDTVQVTDMSLLSSRCHVFQQGDVVSCDAISLDGRISLQAWPSAGCIHLDIFNVSNGDDNGDDILKLPPKLENVFDVVSNEKDDEKNDAEENASKFKVKWAYKNRGFRFNQGPFDGSDLHRLFTNRNRWKTKVASVETDFQTVDVVDQIISREEYNRKKMEETLNLNPPENNNEKLVNEIKPDRLIYLNGVLQSRLFGEAAYHEALVHPAMISHPDPKRVVIIGGGEGATLREVLKYDTVETVIMVEIDEGMVNASKEYMLEWNDCSNIVGSADSCYDDPRTELFFADAGAWFIEKFANPDTINESDKYDVIIMDSLDPLTAMEFSDILFSSDDFIKSIYNGLTEEGVYIAQVGEADSSTIDYPDYLLGEKNFLHELEKQGFEKINRYADGNSGLDGVWGFMMAFKDTDSKTLWYSNEAEIEFELHRRTRETKDGNNIFRFFDGATMMTYQYPARPVEETYCKSEPKPYMCENLHGFDPYVENISIDQLEVKPSKIPGAGRGLFFKKDFPAGSYIAIDEGVHDIMFMPSTMWVISDMIKYGWSEKWKLFDYYTFGYGFSNEFYGDPGFSVDASIMTFINHGCNETYNMGWKTSVTELTADPNQIPADLSNSPIEVAKHNPFIDRNHLVYLNGLDHLNRDVKEGEELLDNYLSYLNDLNWKDRIGDYKAQCLKQAAGAITEYEADH